MHNAKVNPLIQWWHGKDLPSLYIFPPQENKPKGFLKLLRLYFRTWLVHPIKRRVAKYYLWFLQTFFGLKVIAITGSSGKTSTKDMLYSILSQKGKTVASHLNIDSTFNIPTTILKCNPSTRYLILEMGVEYIGDMSFYMWIVTPDIAVITNIFQTHTFHLKNIEGVAKEKGLIAENLPSTSLVVLNKENKYSEGISSSALAKTIWFGEGGEVEAKDIKSTFSGTEFVLDILGTQVEVKIPLIGKHFVSNALAASAAAHSLGIPIENIKKGLEKALGPNQRLTVKKLKNGAIVLDDTYNNNPSAAKATFKAVNEVRGKKKLLIVYGDMKELGETEVQRHKEIGKVIEGLKADFVVLVGPLSVHTQSSLKKTKNTRVDNASQVLEHLKPEITKDSLIVVKGARSLKLEEVVSKLV